MRAPRIITTTLLACLLTGCGGGDLPEEETLGDGRTVVAMTGNRDPQSPEGVVHRWIFEPDEKKGSLIRENARALFVEGSKGGKTTVFTPSHMKNARTSIEIGEAEIEGDSAEVPVRTEIHAEGFDSKSTGWVVLVREEGDWKIDPFASAKHELTQKTEMTSEVRERSAKENRQFMRKQMPVNAAHEDLFQIQMKVQEYYSSHGMRLPASLEELTSAYPDIPRTDPWGNAYVYRLKSREKDPGFQLPPSPLDAQILSYGADGREGGEGENADLQH